MTKNKCNWNEWFNVARVIAPDELSFYVRDGDGVVVIVLRDEPLSKSRIRNATYVALFLASAVIGALVIDQIWGQLGILFAAFSGFYAYATRYRISIETTSRSLVAETRHFGIITSRSRICFKADARFSARRVGGFQNTDNELVFTDGAISHFCLFVTNPHDFGDLLRNLNAAICNEHVPTEANSQSESFR